MFDHHGVGQSGIRPAQVGRNVGMTHRQAADVGLVEDRVGPRPPGPDIAVPIEFGSDHRGETAVVDGPGIRVEQEATGVVVMALPEVRRAGGAHGIPLPGGDSVDSGEPPSVGMIGQRDSALGAMHVGAVEEHQIDGVTVPGIDRELRATVDQVHPRLRREVPGERGHGGQVTPGVAWAYD